MTGMAQKPATPTARTAKAKAPKRSTTKAAIKKPVAAAKPKALKPAQPPVPKAKIKPKPLTKNAELSKRQLLDRIVTESGMKKGDARTVLDAVLSGLRDAIADGHDIAASPLGKIKLVRKKDTPNGELAVLRVKLKDPKKIAANQAASRAENEAVAKGAEPG
jgi:DNA-binding protein HU-alpha